MPTTDDLLRYRRFHDAVVPGVADLHRMVRAIADTVLPEHARILVSGAGGGRELETLGASPRSYEFVGVDPSPEMLELARVCIAGTGIDARTTLIEGVPVDLPAESHDAATSLFVMHFLPDDGTNADYLREIRKRLRVGAPYLHADVCYDGPEGYRRLASVYQRHAELGGIPSGDAQRVASRVADLPIIAEEVLLERLRQAGFRLVAPFYRGLWYTGWWSEAA